MKNIKYNLCKELHIKNSTFYSYSFNNVTNSEFVNKKINELSKIHKNAKHICYSYRILNNGIIDEYYFESSEPHGSAGLQIYNILKKEDIVNCLIIIVREFSGSKLGLGLLSRSYNNATKLIIKDNLVEYYSLNSYIIKISNKSFEYFKKKIWKILIFNY